MTLSDLETTTNQHWPQVKSLKTNDGDGVKISSSDGVEISLSALEESSCRKVTKPSNVPSIHPPNVKVGKEKARQRRMAMESSLASVTTVEKSAIKRLIVGIKWRIAKGKCPSFWKPKSEAAALAVEGGSKVEFLLCGMRFPVDQSFLSNPNVWIADSAATVHNTPHTIGMTNVRDAAQSDTITMGNGAYGHAAMIADIGGVICNKYGVEQGCGVLTEVTLLATYWKV